MKTIKYEVNGEIVEKKSKFLADVFYVSSTQEAEEKIEEVRKKYFDARHHCFAYRIYQDGKVIERASDDGEPSGTAGGPMLNILTKNNLGNIVVIVTRYFGGILLGTGGLVKAYSQAMQVALEKAEFVEEIHGYEVKVELEYNQLENFKYFCKQNTISIIKIEYEKIITLVIELSDKEIENRILENDRIKSNILEYQILEGKNIRKQRD
ncbi:MAG: YigZ family protein [Clostridia bacterium]